MERHDRLGVQIALGWITCLLVLLAQLTHTMLTGMLTEASKFFVSLHYDPGQSGLKMLAFIVPYYALMPVYVSVVSGRRSRLFRWLAVGFASLSLVFNLLHHLSHWYGGQRPDFSSHVMDLTLHIVGSWVLFNSIRWAKLPPTAEP